MFININNKFMAKFNLAKLVVVIFGGLLLIGCNQNLKERSFISRDNIDPKHIDSLTFYGEHISPEKEQELLAENVVYFGYDKEDITDRYELLLLAHAKKMLQNPNLILRIEGHTDERGSSEYNIGLGERRAKAVIRFMEFKGVPNNRLLSVSYGKEKPIVTGHNEEAWRLNRRAELNYE